MCEGLGVSARRACRVLGRRRATQPHQRVSRPDEARLTAAAVELVTQYARYGYLRITVLLRQASGQSITYKNRVDISATQL